MAEPLDTLPEISLDPALQGAFVMPEYVLEVSPDRLEARLAFAPFDRQKMPCSTDVVRGLGQLEGLVFLDEEAVEQALEAAAGQVEPPPKRVIARGEAAIDGEDGRLEWLGEFFESEVVRLPDGSVDHYHRTQVSVYEGQALVRIHPPTHGRAGCDVFGEKIKPKPGKPAPIKLDPTVRRDGRDPQVVVAARPGLVEYKGSKLSVSDVLDLDRVDFASGSVEFEGAVQVHHDVHPRFSVYAGGSLHIGGIVDSARVESRTRIQIDGGVLGHGRAEVICAGDVSLSYARDARIHSEGAVQLQREALNVQAEVEGDLLAESARIVGGHWRVGGKAIVGELGSREELGTRIVLGAGGQAGDELKSLTRERKRTQERLVQFRRRWGRVLRGEIGAPDEKELRRLRERLEVLEAEARESRSAEYTRRLSLRRQRQDSKLWVQGAIHPGVEVALDGGRVRRRFGRLLHGPLCVLYDTAAKEVAVSREGEVREEEREKSS